MWPDFLVKRIGKMIHLLLHTSSHVPSLSCLLRAVLNEEWEWGPQRAKSFNSYNSPPGWLLLSIIFRGGNWGSHSSRVLPETREPKRSAEETSRYVFLSYLLDMTPSTPQNNLNLEATRIFSGYHGNQKGLWEGERSRTGPADFRRAVILNSSCS